MPSEAAEFGANDAELQELVAWAYEQCTCRIWPTYRQLNRECQVHGDKAEAARRSGYFTSNAGKEQD